MVQPLDLTGKVYGRLTVLAFDHSDSLYRRFWRCRCQCGAIVVVYGVPLRDGRTQSCGCLRKEVTADRSRTHGGSKRPEFFIWAGMLDRCYRPSNKNFAHYGGAGVTVHARWRHDFATWFADVGERPSPQHSIDRWPNPAGNYEPGNVRWATQTEQARNKRTNRRLTFNGRTLTVTEWALIVGLSRATLDDRLRRGMTVDEALSTPPKPRPVRTPSR